MKTVFNNLKTVCWSTRLSTEFVSTDSISALQQCFVCSWNCGPGQTSGSTFTRFFVSLHPSFCLYDLLPHLSILNYVIPLFRALPKFSRILLRIQKYDLFTIYVFCISLLSHWWRLFNRCVTN